MPEKKVSVKDINHHFIESSQNDICNGVLAVAQKLVSSDFNHILPLNGGSIKQEY